MTVDRGQLAAATERDGTEWPRAARYFGLGVLTVAVAVGVVLFTPVFQTALLGFLLALLLDIPARLLSRHTRLSYPRAVAIVYLAVLAILIAGVVALLPSLASGLRALVAALQTMASSEASVVDAAQIDERLGALGTSLASIAAGVLGAALTLIGNLAFLITILVLALFLSFVLLMDLYAARGSLADWVPPAFRREATLLLRRLDQIWSAFLTAQVAYAVVLGIFSIVQYWLMGVPFPLVMGTLNGFLALIPSIGGLVGSLAVAVPCLLLGSSTWPDMPHWWFALLVLLVNIPITQGCYYLLALPLLGRSVRLPVFVVTLGVLLGLALNSIILAFLTVPIVSSARILGGYVLAKVARRDPFPGQEVPEALEPGFFSQIYVEAPEAPAPAARGREGPRKGEALP